MPKVSAPASQNSAPKVSVVVPTFRPGDGLDRLVASLDAQTLPTSEFEVVFVDDGSPDGTYERLRAIAATRPHFRVERIENSGWPCRPRNVGTDLARGEYIAYMDHDDVLYPDALRAGHEFAILHGADVVNGKEARTHDATWAIDTYRADAGQSAGRVDQHPLIPMNPHKLYRRAFLVEHGIRFREGGRVLWEDIFFNLLVARHARVISTMASVPYYHWYTTPGSGSHGFLRSTSAFWDGLREVLVATNADLDGDAHSRQREQLLLHQYRHRLLVSFDRRFAGRPHADRDLIYAACRRLQSDFELSRFDDRLSRSMAIRAHLLRGDERALLEALPSHDPDIPGHVRLTAARWVDGRLELEGTAEWTTSTGRRHALVRDGETLRKVLPEEYATAVPSGLRDVTAEVQAASAEFGLRSRESRVTWMLPGGHAVGVVDVDGAPRLGGRVTGVLDPETAVFGRGLEPGLWDLNGRCTLAGSAQQDRVAAAIPPTAVVFGDEVRLAYVNDDGFLTVALGPDEGRTVRRLAPQPGRVTTVAAAVAGAVTVCVPLRGLGVQRDGTVRTVVEVAAVGIGARRHWQPRPARLVARHGEGVLELDVPARARALRLRVGDRGEGDGGVFRLGLRDPSAPTLRRERGSHHAPARPRVVRRVAARLRKTAGRGVRWLRRTVRPPV